MQFALLCNPENRRVRYFVEACEKLGLPSPIIYSWLDCLRNPGLIEGIASNADAIRMESPGENEGVTAELIAWGGGSRTFDLEFGQIAYLREYYSGFSKILDLIDNCRVPSMNSASDIKVMFDKWASHLRFEQVALSRPSARLAPKHLEAMWENRPAHGRVFLKPLYASSASGVCALKWSGSRISLVAPIDVVRRGKEILLFNSLKVRSYDSLSDVKDILSQLLPQGMIEEAWIPKAKLEGQVVDLRIIVIAGVARHWVVRQSRSPMTNLHLGNQRGDSSELINIYGEQLIVNCKQLAVDAATCFPTSLYAGVDIMFNKTGEPLIVEINAFGDLLPGILDNEEDTYLAELNAWLLMNSDGILPASRFPKVS